MKYETLRFNPDYDIEITAPHRIYKRKTYVNDKLMKEKIDSEGYIRVFIEDRYYRKHLILAYQWLGIDNIHQGRGSDSVVIDHINRNKLDGRICNLRVIPRSINSLNTSRKDYIWCNIPEEEEENLRYIIAPDNQTLFYFKININTNEIYFYSGVDYRVLTPNKKSNKYVLYTNEGDKITLTLNDILSRIH